MNKFSVFNLRLILCTGSLLVLASPFNSIFAQDQVGAFVQAAQADGNKILQAYANPFLVRHADGWGDGWTYTAKHERITFKLISVSADFVGASDQTFDAAKLGLSSDITFRNSSINQTFAGGANTANATFDIHRKDILGQDHYASFSGPDGTNFKILGQSAVPTVVTPQFGIGILPQTELLIRFLPDIHFGNKADVSVWGLGVKQTLTNLIFGKSADLIGGPPFELAAFTGYSSETLGYKLDIEPTPQDRASSGNSTTNYQGQRIQLTSTNFTVGALISRKISFLTPHVGLGYSSAQTRLNVLGLYPVTAVDGNGMTTVTNIHDPFLVSGGHSGLNANIGLNLNLFLVKINTDYVLSRYNRLNIGLSIYF